MPATNLSRRRLGRTQCRVTTLGLGAAPLGNLYQAVDDRQAMSMLDTAWDLGLRYFDTAPFYGFGLSERRLGDMLRCRSDQSYVLSTKVGRLLRPVASKGILSNRLGFCSPMPFEPEFDYSYTGIMRSYEDSLQRLGLSRIDVLLIHDLTVSVSDMPSRQTFDTCMQSGYKALEELRAAGLVKAIGLGANHWDVCTKAMAYGQFDCFLLAGRYTLLEQNCLDEFVPKCLEHGASIIVGGVYNSGILVHGTRGTHMPYYDYQPATPAIIKRVQSIECICNAHGVTLPAAALQFPLASSWVSSIIPGLGAPEHIQAAMNWMNEEIPIEFWREMITEGHIHPDAPIPQEATDES